MFSQKKISVDGITLSCLDWQRGSEPLLLLHGLADCSLVWLELGDYLEEKYHIVAPDLRGHGESDKPECGYRFDDYIRDLESLLSYLKWEKVHVIAHSWSAKLACIWAKKSPNSFKSLALVDPFFIKSIPSIFELTFPILYRLLPFLKMIGPFST